MHKPPVAPKPKLDQPQRPLLSPSALRKDGLSLPSASTQRRVKPVLPPKPSLSKLSPALKTKDLASQPLHQPPHRETPRAEGARYPEGDGLGESKKPDWDYIIPICLCSKENCACVRNNLANAHKVEKDLNVWHKLNGKTEENAQLLSKSQRTFDTKTISINLHKALEESFKAERNLSTEHSNGNVGVPHRTRSDEANGEVEPPDEPGRGPEEEVLGSGQAPRPKPPKPVHVPRKARTAGLTAQERVEEEREEIPGWDRTEMNGKEVKVSLEGKSAPVERPAAATSAGKACAAPDRPPRTKPLLFGPEKTSTPDPPTLLTGVLEEDLGRGSSSSSSSRQTQVAPDRGAKAAVEKEGDGGRDGETVYTRRPSGSRGSPVAAEEGLVKEGPEKPGQPSGPMARSSDESPAEGRAKLGHPEERQSPEDCVLRGTFLTPAPVKPRQPSLSKQKARSFSAADVARSEGQKRNSFRRLLDLKLKMMSGLKTKADQIPGGAAPNAAQSADGEIFIYEQNLPRPVVEVEQCVDREEDLYYENFSHYEDIADYINVEVGSALSLVTPSGSGSLQPAAYNDEGIYEEPDPYISFQRPPGHPGPTASDCER